ncbi:MAG: Fe(3+) ABC transporter substrate-binding protein [Hyphomicrobiaceae bacterium]
MLGAAGAVALGLAAFFTAVPADSQSGSVVNIYSYREPVLIDPLLKAFTAKTGIKTKVIFAKAGLTERMAAEGQNSPADVLLTVDIGRLAEAKSKGVSQPLTSKALTESIPAAYRDPDGHWFGVSMRARVIYASKERVKQTAISYEDLADPKWKGKICSRSAQHTYNLGLIASIIAHMGEAKAEAWLRGFKANLARKPAGGDREQVRDVFAGRCDIAIGNTYYMAAMQRNKKNPEQQKWAAAVRIIFPNVTGRGTHVNLSGMVLAKYAPHKAAAIKLMEFLASAEGQKIYAEIVSEYPLKAGIPLAPHVESWGHLKADSLPLARIAELRKKASTLVDKVNFDAGP